MPATRAAHPKRPTESRLTPLTLKSIAADGVFEGYASLFNREDLGRDIVLPGAFAETLRARGASGIKMLYQHDPAEPIGVWETIVEDARGLFVRGRLMAGVARAREVLALMRAGAIDGLSIGFKAVRARRDRPKGVRRIEQIDLWEISIVTFPMLPEARVSAVITPRAALAADVRARPALRNRGHRHAHAPAPRPPRPRSPADGRAALAATLAGERALIALMRIGLIEHKRFNPAQLRVPAGNPEGGQWTGGDSGDADDNANLIQLINGGRRGGQGNAAREQYLRAQIDRAREAARRVRELEPDWKEPQSAYATRDVEGRIAHQEAVARAAEARLAEVTRDAVPGTNPSWGVNRLTKELYEQGYRLERPTRDPGVLLVNPAGDQVRIMQRPTTNQYGPLEKFRFGHYYRFRGRNWPEFGNHIPIPDKN